MKFFQFFICLLCISQDIIGRRVEKRSIYYADETFFQDVEEFTLRRKPHCLEMHSCTEFRHNDSDVRYVPKRCDCDRQCWKSGTCCIDSPFRINDPPIYECTISHVSEPYYMVHRCPADTDIDSFWKNLCEKKWNGQDDMLMLSPVTSLETSTTYNNYYCFKCHEDTDNYVSWNLRLLGDSETSGDRYNYSEYSVTYDQIRKTWMATELEHPMIQNPISIPVKIEFEVPDERQISPISCVLSMISDCPNNWIDKQVHDKCLLYGAYVYGDFKAYKNPHCALCNSEYLGRLDCDGFAPPVLKGFRFSFEHLIRIREKDKAGNTKKCDDDHLWDPYSEKCRKKTCAIARYVVKNNRCVPP